MDDGEAAKCWACVVVARYALTPSASVWPLNLNELHYVKVSRGNAMIQRIISQMSDNPYEATLAISAVCSCGSLLLAAIV
jgi:hypothetical protein